MDPLRTLILGLGLFFLGIQLVGEHLRRLSGDSFRRAVLKFSQRPGPASLAGLLFGALMQSATAVTFILAGMARSGFISTHGAAPVIVWSNVGLTALAFLVTLDIRDYVAYLVGAAGIFSALARRPGWRATAGVCLGVGLILFGLESMGEAAAPLRHQAWLARLVAATANAPLVGFALGAVLAALLQSNSGAAMLVITLAGVGTLSLEQGAILIYGTNIGAIPLRWLLSMNMDRPSRRLVRLEDLFCALSGLVMGTLYLVERCGAPLVLAAARHALDGNVKLQLALVFLVSNLLPALLLSPVLRRVVDQVERWMPGASFAARAQPKYLDEGALSDPPTAVDLMARELARLFAEIEVGPRAARAGEDGEPEADPAFGQLIAAIEQFGARLAGGNALGERDQHRLHLLRAELSLIRYLDEAVREFDDALAGARRDPAQLAAAETLERALATLIERARASLASREPRSTAELRAHTRRHGELVKLRSEEARARSSSPTIAALADRFELAAWILHRLAKVMEEFAR